MPSQLYKSKNISLWLLLILNCMLICETEPSLYNPEKLAPTVWAVIQRWILSKIPWASLFDCEKVQTHHKVHMNNLSRFWRVTSVLGNEFVPAIMFAARILIHSLQHRSMDQLALELKSALVYKWRFVWRCSESHNTYSPNQQITMVMQPRECNGAPSASHQLESMD